MPKSDDDFEAEFDADTLVNAKLIRGDDKRFERAKKHLRKKNEAVTAALKDAK